MRLQLWAGACTLALLTCVSEAKGSQTGIVVQAQTAARLVVSGIATPRAAGTASSVTVEAKDAYGNRITNYTGTITFSSTDSRATLPANYRFTSGTNLDNGIHTFTNGVTLKTAGSQSVTATDTVTGSLTGSQSAIQVNPGAASVLVVSGIPSPQMQDTASPQVAGTTSTIRVEARDGGGNIARGYTGTVRISTTDGQATKPADHAFTAADSGVFTFSGLILRTAATQSVTATDIATTSITGTQSGVVVTPGPAATLRVSGIGSPVTAGDSRVFTVEARDAFGNRATAYLGTVAFGTSDPQGTVPAPHPFTAAEGGFYSASAVLRTAGSQSISAADTVNGAIAGSLPGINVNPASAVTLTLTGIPGAVTAGDSNAGTVTAYDPYHNVATGYLGTVHFSSSDLHASLPPDRAFLPADLGRVTVVGIVLTSAGTQNVTAADTLTPSLQATQGTLVTAAPASSLTASGFPATTSAGSSATLTVAAWDVYGNLATAYVGTVSFSSSDAQAALPPATTFTP